MGFSLFVAGLTVYLRDLRHALPQALQLGFFVTPIFWSLSGLSSTWQKIVCAINPNAAVIDGLRRSVLYGEAGDLDAHDHRGRRVRGVGGRIVPVVQATRDGLRRMSVEGGVKVDHLWKRFHVDHGRRLLRDHLSRSSSRRAARRTTTRGAGC